MRGSVTIVFRYDDYAASLGDSTMEANERAFLDAFAEQGVPLTVGVVPRIEGKRLLADDPERLRALRDAVATGQVGPALHGLTHEALARQGTADSEFAGLPPAAQLERLREGKRLLEDWLGTPVAAFIPPWNTYDEATVDALTEAGFQVLCAALSGPPVSHLQFAHGRYVPIEDATPPLVALPHTTGLPDVQRTARACLRRRGRSFLVCMFHEFSFANSADPLARVYGRTSLAGLARLLQWCRAEPGVELATAAEAASRYARELSDGRVDAARARWQFAARWRRVPVVGRLVARLLAPRALPGPRGPW
ncbi:MAG: DUF2334 domain-containing protein [Planctomycetes bacterium]|nr:DUF2334 domain-containing protein [Planctomycetota bacterium]